MQLRSTAIIVVILQIGISNGVACLSRLAVVRFYQKIYYFSLSPSFSATDRAGGVVTSREKNVGRRREGNYLKVSLGSHPLCDKGRSCSADWKSPRTREHASSSSSSPRSISSPASSLARHSETRHCERASSRQAFLHRDADRVKNGDA